jgi:Transaldolase/Fructose-6-phosphate aldolase/Pyridine nucleotide-disulphide oxidoreductase
MVRRSPAQHVRQDSRRPAGPTRHRCVPAEGISIDVTLIFSLTRYDVVINAYLNGMERAHRAGLRLDRIGSVASFFVSRVDSDVTIIEMAELPLLSVLGPELAHAVAHLYRDNGVDVRLSAKLVPPWACGSGSNTGRPRSTSRRCLNQVHRISTTSLSSTTV